MGLIFAFIIGIYWTLKSLKDSIFIQLVDKMHLPYAKTASLISLIPILMFYTRLLEKTSKEKMLTILPAFYGVAILCFGLVMFIAQASQEEIDARSIIPFISTRLLGYSWYVFVESFGSLLVALFWAFATDITDPTSAKKGFPFIVAIGQVGGIICPYNISSLPHWLGLTTDSLSIAILGILSLSIVLIVKYFLRTTPKHLLKSVHKNEKSDEKVSKKYDFLRGLRLILKHRYLRSIFAVIFIYELVITIFDFNFKLAAGATYSGVALSNYLGFYSSSVNIISLLCLLLGISNVTRFLGIGVALTAMPIIFAMALFGFISLDSLFFLFTLMIGSKAINYALNGPALKQLYIPTTSDVRFKAQAWIETFGSRTSKEVGSLFNMLLGPFQSIFGAVAGKANYIILSGFIGFPLLVVWFFIALYLGKNFTKAIKQEEVIC